MTIKYKSKNPRTARKSRPTLPKAVVIKKAEDAPGLINGQQAGSSYEWNVARAAWALGWKGFEYQVPLYGGRMVRGGIVVDFIFPTRPARTVVQPEGEYWHQNTDQDQIEDMRIMEALGRDTRILHPGTIECGTFEAAMQFLSREIGRA